MIVGWGKDTGQWESPGSTSIIGNLESGHITSKTFLPNDHEIMTLAGIDGLKEAFPVLELGNYFPTTNNNGMNEFLIIDGIETVSNNILAAYNRFGIFQTELCEQI